MFLRIITEPSGKQRIDFYSNFCSPLLHFEDNIFINEPKAVEMSVRRTAIFIVDGDSMIVSPTTHSNEYYKELLTGYETLSI